ncbi:hypothetical protein DU900_11730 [Salmonella enterica subsp. enterica serovar Lille]|nr:hypothetical protein [Salmonella enterica subsp. enterica serovar Lille]EBS1260489.1 hypothetical protein [Salmonella enterica subsp. enterica serovar Lille]EBS3169277.1 hypothetical protein [Salmonella enterica subsp. enterica serovar Lille]EBX3633490.1 hypothetical protein [Salmonella enterica subsp. enterica serovar Lille]EBY2588318.1 hypothetical protein [Salmonella enterica subsp. enterica serovar Lille]
MNARALMPDDLVIVESAPEKIDTFSCKMTVPPSGHHNGFFSAPTEARHGRTTMNPSITLL